MLDFRDIDTSLKTSLIELARAFVRNFTIIRQKHTGAYSGTFTNAEGKVVTVVDGLITSIEDP